LNDGCQTRATRVVRFLQFSAPEGAIASSTLRRCGRAAGFSEARASRSRARRARAGTISRRRAASLVISILSGVSKKLAARCAEALFRTPPAQAPTRGELAWLVRGRRRDIRLGGGSLATWTWGSEGSPAVLLVHGWGGHAGRLTAFVGPLLEAGFAVVAIDAPAHGSSAGRRATLPDFGRAVLAAARELGPFSGVIAHSMGAAGAALAIRDGFAPSRAVFLAPPADPEEFGHRFARALGLRPDVRDAMKARLERRYATRWPELKLIACAPKPALPLLIFHDLRDTAVPLSDGGAILLAWRGATIVRTRGLGHHKILRDPAVVRAAVSYIARGNAAEASPAGA